MTQPEVAIKVLLGVDINHIIAIILHSIGIGKKYPTYWVYIHLCWRQRLSHLKDQVKIDKNRVRINEYGDYGCLLNSGEESSKLSLIVMVGLTYTS